MGTSCGEVSLLGAPSPDFVLFTSAPLLRQSFHKTRLLNRLEMLGSTRVCTNAKDPSLVSVSVGRSMACDNCRRRKVKCNRSQPCSKCVEVNLQCRYHAVPQRKGPKGRTARVLSALPSLVDYMEGPSSSSSSSSPATTCVTPSMSCDAPPSLLSRPQRVSSTVLLAHVNVFLKHLYPIMPVFDSNQVVEDCDHVETLSPSRYAFLLALCAATHLQLNLDAMQDDSGLHSSEYGKVLVAKALSTLQEFDPIENLQIDTVLSSFFLFAAYGNMDRQNHAWYYLSQSISYAYALNLHQEQTYASLPHADAELRRRIFWLLFITER